MACAAHLDAVAVGYETSNIPFVAGGGAAVASIYQFDHERAEERAATALGVFEVEAKQARIWHSCRAMAGTPAGAIKGKVERTVRFAARQFADVDDLNAQAAAWCSGVAADRPCPEHQTLSVREAFAEEAPRLLKLPDDAYPLIERVAAKVGKTPYVRFDLNDYSVPHTQVGRTLTVLADPHQVRVVDGIEILACHRRSYDKGAQIEDGTHVEALVADKRAARRHRGTNRLAKVAPSSQTLLLRAAERGDNLGTITAALLRLLELWGRRTRCLDRRGARARRASPQRSACSARAPPRAAPRATTHCHRPARTHQDARHPCATASARSL
jgi:hypothetical protein